MIVSCPSWVIPGTYAENLGFLAERKEISGVELLFFIYDKETKDLLEQEWETVKSFASRFVYTVHLPDTVLPEHGELVERFLPYARNFVVHPYRDSNFSGEQKLLDDWTARYGDRGKKPETFGAISPFLIENTYSGLQDALLPLLPPDTGLVMDTGHLVLLDKDPIGFFAKNEKKIHEIHLHGVDIPAAEKDGRLQDHRPIDPARDSWFAEFIPCLRRFSGVVNLEVFSWEEVEKSLAALRGAGLL